MANTTVQIKRSSVTAKPASANTGELAYSYLSNTLFIGTNTSDGAINIGGYLYTSTIDAATSANTPGTLVKRDANGAFNGTFNGNFTGTFNGSINTANSLALTENFSISGGDITAGTVGFNGTAPVVLNASLNAVPGLGAGAYGSATQIPVVTVGANGRVLAISTVATTSGNQSFTITGNTGSAAFFTGNTLTIVGGGPGVTTNYAAGALTLGLDTTVVRANSLVGGVQTISSDLVLTGNVTLLQSGVQTFNIFSTTIQTGDSLLKLAANNVVGDVVDIGFYGASNTGSSVQYHGLVREGTGGTSAGNFYLFKNLPTDPTGNTVTYASLVKATLVANLTGGLVSGLAAAIGVGDGGTGINTLAAGSLTYGSGTTTPMTTLAIGGVNSVLTSTGSAPQWTANSSLVVGTATTALTANIATYDVITTATTGVYYPELVNAVTGTLTTFANNALSFNAANGALSATTFVGALAASGITGQITVGQGGTGASTFLANSVIINPTSSTTGPLSSITGGQGQVLQINAGVPVFAYLDGGAF